MPKGKNKPKSITAPLSVLHSALLSAREALQKFWHKNHKIFLIQCLTYGLVYVVIIASGLHRVDDWGRIALGYTGWGDFSRYFNVAVSPILNGFNWYLNDLTPIPQILSVLTLSLAGTILVNSFARDHKTAAAFAVTLLGLNPLFLYCLTYRFDCWFMTLSVLAAVLPLLFVKRSLHVYNIAVAASTLLMCLTYQASAGIFPVAITLYALVRWHDGGSAKSQLKLLGASAVAYIIALVFYRLAIVAPVGHSYVSIDVLSLQNFIPGVIENLSEFYAEAAKSTTLLWRILIAIILVVFIAIEVNISKRKIIPDMIITVAALAFSAVVCFGPYIIFENPLVSYRSVYGIGALITIIAVIVCGYDRIWLGRAAALVLSFCIVSFSLAFGNLAKIQTDYIDYRAEILTNTLAHTPEIYQHEGRYTIFEGTMGYAPAIEHAKETEYYTVMEELLPDPIAFGGGLRSYYYSAYYVIPGIIGNREEPILGHEKEYDIRTNCEVYENTEPIAEDAFEEIRISDKDLMIIFKDTSTMGYCQNLDS